MEMDDLPFFAAEIVQKFFEDAEGVLPKVVTSRTSDDDAWTSH